MKQLFNPTFEAQLRRALSGYAPWKTGEAFKEKAMMKKSASEAQITKLGKLGIHETPSNSWEASQWIDAAVKES